MPDPVDNKPDVLPKISYEALGLSPSVGGHLAFLEMYLDESYGDDSPYIVVGGFVSTVDRWADFASAWKSEVLERFGIPFLHMKDVCKCKPWSSSQDDPLSVARALIAKYADMGVGCAINRNDFMAATTHEDRSRYGTDYTIGVMVCLNTVIQYLDDDAPGTTLSIFLEDGHRNTQQAIKILKYERHRQQGKWDHVLKLEDEGMLVWRNPARDSLGIKLGVVDAVAKASMIPLQAADVLVYSVLNQSDPFFFNIMVGFDEAMPLRVGNPSVDSLRASLNAARDELIQHRNRKRRFKTVVSDLKRQGKQADSGDDYYILNIDDFHDAEVRAAKNFKKETPGTDTEVE